MKLHWMILILIVLVVAAVSIQLFVPQTIGADGKVRYFGGGDSIAEDLEEVPEK